MPKRSGVCALTGALVVFATDMLVPGLAHAQALEEIVVTARKTEEGLQDVPISISAFSGDQMRERGIFIPRFTANYTTARCVRVDLKL